MKIKGLRPWYDGSGKNKRLRVKGIVDLPPPKPPEPGPNDPDPGKVREEHAAAQKAIREGDEHAVGKIFEPILDDMHRSQSRQHEPEQFSLDQRMTRRVQDFEAALTAELQELSRSTRGWGWAYRWAPHALVIRCHDPDGAVWEYRADEDRLVALRAEHSDNARAMASAIVLAAQRLVKNARIRVMVGGHVPVETERAMA